MTTEIATPMTLADLAHNVSARIIGFTPQSESLNRLFSMGVVPGAQASVLRAAPLGDPLQVKVEGTLLSIRKQDAQKIQVENV